MPALSANNHNQEPGYILHNLMLFGEVLRRLGLEFGSGNMLGLVRATEDVSMGHKQDFRYAARCLLVHRKQDLPLFDEAFQVFWRRPATAQSPLDLRSLGEERRYRTPQIIPPSGSDSDTAGGEGDSPESQPAVDLSRTYSAREVLREKDFADFTPAEMSQAWEMMAELSWNLGRRRTRRLIPGEGASLDLRRTFRRNLRYGGELLELARRQPNDKPRPLALICDVSGSMERYTRMLLHFIHTIAGGWGRVEAFLFATRLTRITRFLGHRSVDQAVREVAKTVPDWAGGTRIGEALKAFNFRWSRRVMRNGAIVLIISDGWDRGEPELLAREMARLQRSCHRLIWLNPLLGSPSYQPLTQGMQAALPYVDDFLPVHNLNSLEALARHLNRLGSRIKTTEFPLYKRGNSGDQPGPEKPTLPQSGNINPALASTFTHPLWTKDGRQGTDNGRKADH
jgi:uncharacterized protein